MKALTALRLRNKLFELYQLTPAPDAYQLKMIGDIVEYYNESMHQGWELSATPKEWVESMVDLVTYIINK